MLHEEARTPLAAVDLPSAASEPSASPEPAGPTVSREPCDVLVVVGPEGGISARELELLEAAGAVPVRLGPHVLRTSTAGPVALALLAQRLGRWG